MDKRMVLAVAAIAAGAGLLGGAYTLHRKRPPVAAWIPPASASVGPALDELGRKQPKLKKLIDDPRVGSVIKEFAAAYGAGGVEKAKEFARERGFMNASDDITLTVLTETDETAELEGELKALKAQVVGRGDSQLDVLVPWSVVDEEIKGGRTPDELIEKVVELKNVRGVLPAERQEKHQFPFGSSRAADGVGVTHADRWHSAGFKGAGVKVGVLDPEVSKASRYVGSVLPANTVIYPGSCIGAQGQSLDDEGLHGPAAAEIVTAMAPGAQLYLACSLGNDDAAIQWLIQQGVRIISYSAGGTYGPRNGKGRSQDRINKLASQGILWVNAAGNDGKTFHRGQLSGASGFHAFAPGKEAMGFKTKTVDGTVKITLIWDQWDMALMSDYDLFLFDSSMREVARSENRNTVLRQPSETINARLKTGAQYFVGVRGSSNLKPARFIINVHNAGSIEYPVYTGSMGQPADAAGALSVGAVVWSTSTLAGYSSRGPTEDGRLKPEISAPTEVSSKVYKGSFAGTSAAAPHVSGAAALVWGRFPQYTRDQVVQFMLSRSRDLGPTGPDNDYGYGMLDLGDPGAAAAPTRPIATAVPTARPTTTAVATAAPKTPPRTPTSDDDEGSFFDTLITILMLAALGGFILVGGIVYVAVQLLRPRRAHPAPPPAFASAPVPFAPGPPGRPPGPPPGSPGRPLGPPPGMPPGMPMAGPVGFDPGLLGGHPGATVVPVAGGWVASLTVIAGPGLGEQLTLSPGLVSIGRSPGNQLVLPDSMVSSRHAWVEHDGQRCWIRDAESRNGVFVNGQRVQRHPLMPGDVVTIGPAQLRFDVS